MTHRIFNASNVSGAVAVVAMIAATGAGDDLLLGLMLTAIFAVSAYISIKEGGKGE